MTKLKRKESYNDSESESQPLLSSSASSTASFGTPQMMFPGSETSDFDQSQSHVDKYMATRILPFSKRNNQKSFRNNIKSISEASMEEKYRKSLYLLSSQSDPNYLNGAHIYSITNDDKFSQPSSSNGAEQTQSSLVTIFSIWNTTMGSSLLVMAWGVKMAGLIPSIITIILVGLLCMYTAYICLQINREHGFPNEGTEIPELCRLLLGTWAEYLAKCFSIIVLLGAGVVYWVLMSNFLYNTILFVYEVIAENSTSRLTGPGAVICPNSDWSNFSTEIIPRPITDSRQLFNEAWDLYSTVPVFLAFLIFPLLNFKNTTFFTKFNCLGTCSVMYLLVFVVTKSSIWGVNIRWSTEPIIRETYPALPGLLSLSMFIHNIVISLVKNNKHPKTNGRDISIAFCLIIFTYLLVGALFYLCFPLSKACIEDNIFNNFDKSDPMTVIARFLLLFQIATTYPLLTFMLRNDVLSLFVTKNRVQDEGQEKIEGASTQHSLKWVVTFNLLMVLISILVACFIPRIGTIIRYTGAVSGLIYIFTLPSLLKMASLKKKGQLSIKNIIIFTIIPIIGAINLFAQFFVTT